MESSNTYNKTQIAALLNISLRTFQRICKEIGLILEGRIFIEECVEEIKQEINKLLLSRIRKDLPPSEKD